MRSAVCSLLIFVFAIGITKAQHRLSGKVISAKDSTVLRDCAVMLNGGKKSAVTDSQGRFVFEDLANGTYALDVIEPDHLHKHLDVIISGGNNRVVVVMEVHDRILDEVVVSDNQTTFGFGRMRSVEASAIYEGKKTEVIIPDQLIANLATNNARQVYSRVAGLNIWENDGAGLQLSIGGRGLDPNRTSNFNVRQNGYDISADALGYPESYYTPPIEGVGRIEIVRGAASLQYGTQFGGLINFVMKKPVPDKKVELTVRQTMGSFNFYNGFLSASGTSRKLSYYTFYQRKQGDGWRANSDFENNTVYANINYALSSKTKIGFDVTHMDYLAHQPGGLTDEMFNADPCQTNRERNWFKVNWNLFALHFDHRFSPSSELNIRVFGLSAYRYSVGFRPNRVATIDDNSERDLIKGDFKNWGMEARHLTRYKLFGKNSVALVGARYYHGYNHSMQGLGSTGKDADFTFVNPDQYVTYDYEFPNRNASVFLENIFYLNDTWSVTPGIRFEHIDTKSDGYYGFITRDLAGNILEISRVEESRDNARQFVLGGVGVSYRPTEHLDMYSNISQNYRSITFSDMRISNPSSEIDQDLEDESGYSFDVGIRSEQTTFYNFDISFFYLNYNNRIGEVQYADELNRVKRLRSNIGQAVITGIESYGEVDIVTMLNPQIEDYSATVFVNAAFIHSNYRKSELPGVQGNEVEFVPDVNLKTGLRLSYKKFGASFQYTHLSNQYTDATNAVDGGVSAIVGLIPSYDIMDVGVTYQFKKIFKLEANINNIANQMYFTRRATGYPGPGILPSDGTGFYLTVQAKFP